MRKRQIHGFMLVLSVGLLVLSTALNGCQSPKVYKNEKIERTLIYSIGNESVLTFEKGRSLSIPIQGARPANKELHLVAQVFGTAPLDRKDYELKFVGSSQDSWLKDNEAKLEDLRLEIASLEDAGKKEILRRTELTVLRTDAESATDDAVSLAEAALKSAETTLSERKSKQEKAVRDLDAATADATKQFETSKRLREQYLEAVRKNEPAESKEKEKNDAASIYFAARDAVSAAELDVKAAAKEVAEAANTQSIAATNLEVAKRAAVSKTKLAAIKGEIGDLDEKIRKRNDDLESITREKESLAQVIEARKQADLKDTEFQKLRQRDNYEGLVPDAPREGRIEQLLTKNNAPGEAFPALAVVLHETYTERLADGDRLRVQISYGGTDNMSGVNGERREDGARVVSRTFVLYSTESYRARKIPHLVPSFEVRAFPLPDEESEYLFGNLIRENYFVVRLAIRNVETDEDWIINSDTISVSGQALVEPEGTGANRFNVAVQVTPQSREHVYAVLDGEEVNTTRSVVFRTLEFAGTLATAITTGFSGSEGSIRALGIATGIGLPEGRKLWPDRWQGYRRNVVNYAMPNLIKINRNSTSQPHFVFFSKKDIQTLVLESNLFTTTRSMVAQDTKGFKGPPAHVVYLTFDNMEIPYEVATTEQSSGSRGEPLIEDAKMIDTHNAAARTNLDALTALDAKVAIHVSKLDEPGMAAAKPVIDELASQRKRAEAAWMAIRASRTSEEAKSLGDIVKDALESFIKAAAKIGVTP